MNEGLFLKTKKTLNESIITALNEGFEQTSSRFELSDLEEAIEYFNDYYNEFPEEKGEYPNWGEFDNYFTDPDWTDALMNGDDDPLVAIVNKIYELFYKV